MNLYLNNLSYSESKAVKTIEPVFTLPDSEALRSVFSTNSWLVSMVGFALVKFS